MTRLQDEWRNQRFPSFEVGQRASIPDPEHQRRLSPLTHLSIIVPCYNEEAVLPHLFSRLQNVIATLPCQVEVILVDDGSSDRTWSLIGEFHLLDPRWRGVRLSRNFGHQAALWRGLQSAQSDVVAILDADLQDPPELLPEMLASWSAGHEVVYAQRCKRPESFFKRMCYRLYYRVLALVSETPIPLDAGDFCVLDHKVQQVMLTMNEPDPFLRGLRAWTGFRQMAIVYNRDARVAGQSNYTFGKLLRLALSGIFNFSVRPLRLATYSGILVLISSSVWFLSRLIWPGPQETSGAGVEWFGGILAFLAGVQLLSLGLIGEYVGRIFLHLKQRPTTVVAETTGHIEQPVVHELRRHLTERISA